MKVLIWGIPCVGKTEIGKMLAKKLNYKYFNVTDIIKEIYGTIDNFQKDLSDYGQYKEKERIILDIINNNDNFVMVVSLICDENIVDNITSTDTISVELIDSVESVYDRILFYDENDEVYPDSKEYRDAHKAHYMSEVKNDMEVSYIEYRNIPKFNINNRKFESVISELEVFVQKLKEDSCK